MSRRLLLALALCVGVWALAEFPLRAPNVSVFDYANLLDDARQKELNSKLQKLYQETNREVVVVTIASMAPYGSSSVESLAADWFRRWHLASQDVLFLVAVGDRKCRIQLGSNWPKRWDGHCRRVMENDIVPSFKASAYDQGIWQGTDRLVEMQQAGPGASPPGRPWQEELTERTNSIFSMSDIPRPYAILLVGLGVALMAGGFVFSQSASTRLLFSALGVFVIVVALCTVVLYVALVIVFAFLTPQNRRRPYWSRGITLSSSSGGSSWGGSSWGSSGGGGGATGSW
ncbi:MAG: hypothetical protein AMXMBFR33_06560 [Candidatus Xenobia bacterium]